MRRWGTVVAKWLFVVVLFTFLGKKGLISFDSLHHAFTEHPKEIAVAYLAIGIGWIVGTYRWYLLLISRSPRHLKPGRVWQISMVGNFFNVALPGAVSGDVVKAYYVAAETHERTARALSSIVMDRIVGLAALTWVAAAGVLTTLQWEWPGTVLPALRGFVLIAAAIFLAFFTYLFAVRGERDWILRILDTGAQKYKIMGSFHQVYESIKSYDRLPSTVFRAFLLSGIGHLCVVVSCWSAAAALGETSLPLRAFSMVVPVGLLVTAIPLTPAGVGTGHAAFLALFHLLGSDKGADVFSIYVLAQLVIGGMGGVAYLLFKKPKGHPKDVAAIDGLDCASEPRLHGNTATAKH